MCLFWPLCHRWPVQGRPGRWVRLTVTHQRRRLMLHHRLITKLPSTPHRHRIRPLRTPVRVITSPRNKSELKCWLFSVPFLIFFFIVIIDIGRFYCELFNYFLILLQVLFSARLHNSGALHDHNVLRFSNLLQHRSTKVSLNID